LPSDKAESAFNDITSLSDVGACKILKEAGEVKKDDDNIYLNLDTILDTRLGTLAKLDNAYAAVALKSGKYHKRLIDEFEGVDKETFKEAYQQRDLETLKRSVVTNLVFFLRRLIKDSLISSIINQKVENLCFTVNVYPYDFSDPGLVDMLVGCIRFHTYSTSSVKIVSIPDEQLTPEFCRENFQIMIMYDWINWIDKHRAFFEKNGISDVAVVVPELFTDSVPTQEDIDRLDLRKQNPFRMTEEIAAAMIRLKHMPVSLFSIHEGITKDNAAEVVKRVQITQDDIEEYLDNTHPEANIVHDTPLPVVNLDEAYELL
jgi:hypothetical protein